MCVGPGIVNDFGGVESSTSSEITTVAAPEKEGSSFLVLIENQYIPSLPSRLRHSPASPHFPSSVESQRDTPPPSNVSLIPQPQDQRHMVVNCSGISATTS